MKVLMIPSWYPNKLNNINGIFIKQQVEALAENKKLDIAILDMQLFSLSKPLKLLKVLGKSVEKKDNLTHFKHRFLKLFSKDKTKYTNRYEKKVLESFEEVIEKWGKPEIIHAHVTYPAGYAAYLISQKYDIPFVVTEHASFFETRFIEQYPEYTKLILKNAKEYMTVSDFLKNKVKKYRKNVITIPNIVNTDLFIPEKKDKTNNFNLISIGRLIKLKGIDTLLKAMEELVIKRKLNNIKLNILGKSTDIDKWKQFSENLGLKNNVSFHGQVEYSQLPTYINNSDALVIASQFETFGMTGAEAMACGKPVVSTNCGGPSTYIREFNGIIVEKDNPIALADGIEEMMKNYNKYNSDKISGFIGENFSKTKVVINIEEIYNKLISGDCEKR